MRAKEYLQQLQRLDTVINQKIEELDELRAMSLSTGCIDYSKERVQTSLSLDAPFVRTIHRIIDLEEEINAEINKFIGKKHLIINQIQSLQNADYISLLYKRYVEYKRFEQIAVEMNFTYQYVRELHGRSLREFESTYTNLHSGVLK